MNNTYTSLLSTFRWAVTSTIIFLLLPIHTLSAEEIIVIYPTGDSGNDVNEIQRAIDRLSSSREGGIIELKSRNVDGVPTAFNFMTTGDPTNRWSVTIGDGQRGPIEIRGEYDDDEDDSAEQPQTTILGGYAPIRMYGGGELTIRGIRFQEAYQWAIFAGDATSVIIENNVIVNTSGPEDEGLTHAIQVFGLDVYQPSITGKVIVRDNVIDGVYGRFPRGIGINGVDAETIVADNNISNLIHDVHDEFSHGVFISYTYAETIVTDNEISNVNIGIRAGSYGEELRIEENSISNRVSDPSSFSLGIKIDCCSVAGSPPVSIEDNQIEVRDDTLIGVAGGILFSASDIWSWASDSEMSSVRVEGNNIVLTNAYSGINAEAFGGSDGAARLVENLISENTISGNAQLGIELWTDLGDPNATTELELSRNEVLLNDFEDLEVEIADIMLSRLTSDNRVVAYYGDIVLDEGVDNRIIYRPADDDQGNRGRQGDDDEITQIEPASDALDTTFAVAVGTARRGPFAGNGKFVPDDYAVPPCGCDSNTKGDSRDQEDDEDYEYDDDDD